MLKRIAVTGGIASGKSTVCRVFQELGAYVVSADQIAHQLLSSTTPLSQQVVTLLGTQILQDGCIDRKRVAECVFGTPDSTFEKLQALEQLMHPAVFEEIEREYKKARKEDFALFVVEMPLLFEIGQECRYDYTVAVRSPEKECIKRFCLTGYTENEYHKRMKRQLDPQAKASKADFIIENNGTVADLTKRVKEIFYSIQTKREKS